MRILVVTDGYPPADRRASDLACRDIVERLVERGHDVRVAAGGALPQKTAEAGLIHRRLLRDGAAETAWQGVFRKELVNQTVLREFIREFQPATALFFDFSRISASLPLLAESLGIPVCLYAGDDGLATWEMDRWFQQQPRGKRDRQAVRYLRRRFNLSAFPHPLPEIPTIFTSRYLAEMTGRIGKTSLKSVVIPPGVDLRRFPFKKESPSTPSRLLYFGPIDPQRGIDTALQALGLLKRQSGYDGLKLTIAGPFPPSPGILVALKNRAAAAGILADVSFTDYAPDRFSPDLFLSHELILYPAARVESVNPFLLEAMACGLPVVAAFKGGNAELLIDRVNALVVPPENPEACARAVARLLDDPALRETLRANARKTIEERFDLDRQAEAIDGFLSGVAGSVPTAGGNPVSASSAGKEIDEAAPGKNGGHPERWFKIFGILIRLRSLFKPKKVLNKARAVLRSAFRPVFIGLFPGIYRLGRGRAAAAGRREILVVQLADLGDVVLSGPFLRGLRAQEPDARIVLAVQPGLVNAVEKCPYVDEIISFNYRGFPGWNDAFQGSFRWWFKGLGLAFGAFAGHRFDLAVSLRWNEDAPQAASLILMAASGAGRRVAYVHSPGAGTGAKPQPIERLITDGLERGAVKHELEYQADLLRFLGGGSDNLIPEIWTTEEDERKARELLDGPNVGDGGLLIGLAPGSRWDFRRWPAERFIELGRWLQETYGARIAILAGKAEEALAAQVEKGLIAGKTVNCAGRTTIRETAAILKRCRFFVGIDSGPMHVAVAGGVPVVALFGAGEYDRFKPWGPAHAVVQLGLRCSPCPELCLFDEARCIRGISVDQVKNVFAEKLASPDAG